MASKVITLPVDSQEAAQAKLREWLGKDDKVLFIVLGDTNIAFETVAKADVITGGVLQEPRWVIHATTRDWAIPMLQTLSDPKPLVTNWDSVLAIAVSITDVIRDMIPRDGTQPSNIKILTAFLKAEKNGRK
jgi:hypothetical protein